MTFDVFDFFKLHHPSTEQYQPFVENLLEYCAAVCDGTGYYILRGPVLFERVGTGDTDLDRRYVLGTPSYVQPYDRGADGTLLCEVVDYLSGASEWRFLNGNTAYSVRDGSTQPWRVAIPGSLSRIDFDTPEGTEPELPL